MALGRDRSRINVKGGGTLYIREISPTASDTFLSVGYIKDVTFADVPKMVESIDSAGNFIDTNRGEQRVSWTTTLMQSSADEYNLVRNATNKYYDLYYTSTNADGKFQEFSAAPVKITPKLDVSYKSATERGITVEILAMAPGGAFTRTPTDYNIVANVPYVFTENAVAKGLPTDTASTLWTAVK